MKFYFRIKCYWKKTAITYFLDITIIKNNKRDKTFNRLVAVLLLEHLHTAEGICSCFSLAVAIKLIKCVETYCLHGRCQ